MGKVEYENSVDSVKMKIVNGEVEIVNDENEEKTQNEKTENKSIMSFKRLNTLINDLNVLCSKNSNFTFLQEIQFVILGFNTEITKWIEKTQLSIPAKSTRSKLSKDLKTTSKKDLLEVSTFLFIWLKFRFLFIVFYLVYFHIIV